MTASEAGAADPSEQELTLRDLRQAQHLTQERMAELMGVKQANLSRLESRGDLLLSTLSSYVAAMGGKLRLVAEFPNRRPVVIALADMSGPAPPKPQRRRRNGKATDDRPHQSGAEPSAVSGQITDSCSASKVSPAVPALSAYLDIPHRSCVLALL